MVFVEQNQSDHFLLSTILQYNTSEATKKILIFSLNEKKQELSGLFESRKYYFNWEQNILLRKRDFSCVPSQLP